MLVRGLVPEPRAVEIPRDTLVVVDFGAILDGYCPDCTRTFATGNLPDEARATYREILERRAKENSVDFIEGVATAITPLAVFGNHHGEGLSDPCR